MTIVHTRRSNLLPRYVIGFITYSCSTHVPSGTCLSSQLLVASSLAISRWPKEYMWMPT